MIKQILTNNEKDDESESLIKIEISSVSVLISDSLNHEIADSNNDQVRQQQQLSFKTEVIIDSTQEAVFAVSFLTNLSDDN